MRIKTITILAMIGGCLFFIFCGTKPSLYIRDFSDIEKDQLAIQMEAAIGKRYSQGSVSELLVLKEAIKFNPNGGSIWRSMGIPYSKRGYASEFYEFYGKAIDRDPLSWLGNRGYVYLYFYRDYKRAINDFNELDKLTPNFTDHPQATSINFMKGICYLQLGQFDKAHSYWDKHIAEEVEAVGEAYIDSKTFLYQGITYYKQGFLADAKKCFEKGAQYDTSNADLYYWLAKVAYEQDELNEAKVAIGKARHYYNLDSYNDRPYVEEFHQTYLSDIVDLGVKIDTDI